MNLETLILIAIWLFGAYKAWSSVSGFGWEWINRKDPLNYAVKGAFCLAAGFIFFLIQMAKMAWKLLMLLFKWFPSI